MTAEEASFRSQVLVSIQRALWQMITPELVAVAMGWRTGVVHARFVYDGSIGPDQAEIVSEVETLVIADFPPDVRTDFVAVELAGTNGRDFEPDEEWWAYVRRDTPAEQDFTVHQVRLAADSEPFPVVFEMRHGEVIVAPYESLHLVVRGPRDAKLTVGYGQNGVSIFRDEDLQVEVYDHGGRRLTIDW